MLAERETLDDDQKVRGVDMKKILVLISIIAMASCASKSPKDADIKDQNITSARDKSELVSANTIVGVNEEKDIVVQEKVDLNEHLRQVATQIKQKQDELYGSKRFSTRGIYGKLERCVASVNKKSGATNPAPLVARGIVILDQELGDLEAGKFGYDERGRLVALDEVKLRDKIRDLEDKKRRLYEKEEELLSELSRCEARL